MARSNIYGSFQYEEDFEALSNVILPNELAAIYHKDTNCMEFLYMPIDANDPIIQRKFTFYYAGSEFQVEFSQATDSVKLIASGFRERGTISATNHRNLSKFRDFYKKDSMPVFIQTYFQNMLPITFKVTGDFNIINHQYVEFSKNLNFYMEYYDRRSPYILIFGQEKKAEKFKVPCFSHDTEFPSILNGCKIDPVVIDLFEVARLTTNIRMKFLFYFQVLEYCSYYHMSEEFKRKLTNIIKRPDLLSNSSYYGKLITEEFKDNFKHNDDSQKLEKLLMEFLTIEDIKLELQTNIDFFTKDHTFDGGFVLEGILNKESDLHDPPKGFIKSIKTNIEKLRNVLVHIRESRENKVILPTNKNNNLLLPYLHLIQRIAEKVAIQYE